MRSYVSSLCYSLNVGGPGVSVCGKTGDNNYDMPPNAIGGIMPTVIQECYAPGSIIDVESQITAHHKGHFELYACAIDHGETPTQECFNSNPLTFVSDELYGGVKDANFPQRAYIPRTDFPGGLNNNFFHHKYKLPDGLTGDLVLLQWYWVRQSCALLVVISHNSLNRSFSLDRSQPIAAETRVMMITRFRPSSILEICLRVASLLKVRFA